jgi:hypothetical protein
MYRFLVSLALFLSVALHGNPVVSVKLPGLLGNRLFAYCTAKIIAENMGWEVHSKPIWGFPGTYACISNLPSSSYPTELILDPQNSNFEIQSIINNKNLRNIFLDGYFQYYQILKPYTQQIREDWLKPDSNLLLPRNHDSIVVHVRALYPDCYYVPFEYYQKALEQATYDKVYICTDDPHHPFLDNFKPYNPIIVSTRNLSDVLDKVDWDLVSKVDMDDFLFMFSFDKIVCGGVSTYSWWAAFLSDAKEIYAPRSITGTFDYLLVDEERYHYIDTVIGK